MRPNNLSQIGQAQCGSFFALPRCTGNMLGPFVQTRLARYGYDPQGLDGIFGPRTERAVINFQAQNGLVADGVVGPKTWDKLFTPGIRLGPDAVSQSNRQSILTNGSSLVVGGFLGDRWISNKEFGSIPGELYFDRYSARGWIGGAINTPGTRSNGAATNCWDSMTVTLSPSAPQDSRPSVALFATFDPQPRSSEVVTEVSDELRTMVAAWLAQKGMPQATIRIIQMVRADLDGDGSVEELISAAWRVSELSTRASAGDYSVVLLRRANAPAPLEIIGEYYPVADDTTSSSQYAVAALLDLNGDGWLEILLSGSAFESWWMQVYVIDTNWQPNLVLAEGCGA